MTKTVTVGAKGMYGTGLGRYGDTTLSDLTADRAGEFSPLHNASGLFTIEANPTPSTADLGQLRRRLRGP